MLILKSALNNRHILSIQDSRPIGIIKDIICNPDNLKIEGFYCTNTGQRSLKILLNQDIREVSVQGFIVNDNDSLTDPSELVRLKKILEINYDLIKKSVETVNKQKIGKVIDYAIDSNNMYISKLYVSQSILKNFKGGVISVDRNQIIEVTDSKIIIDNLEGDIRLKSATAALQQPY